MADSGLTLPVGQAVTLPGHFDTPVVLEETRRLGDGFECRVRLPDGGLDEVVISADEAAALGKLLANWRSLVESRMAAGDETLFGRKG